MPTSYGLSESLLEHFHLGRQLGEGGNAIVVRAVSRHTGKEYACKCIRKVSILVYSCVFQGGEMPCHHTAIDPR